MSCSSSKYKFGEVVSAEVRNSSTATYQSEPAFLHSCVEAGGLQRATQKLNLKRCSNEAELRLARGWRSADQGPHSRGLHRARTGFTQRSVSAPAAAAAAPAQAVPSSRLRDPHVPLVPAPGSGTAAGPRP